MTNPDINFRTKRHPGPRVEGDQRKHLFGRFPLLRRPSRLLSIGKLEIADDATTFVE